MAASETHIVVELNGDRLDAPSLRGTISDLITALQRVEERFTHDKAKATWRIDDDQVVIGFYASPNGVPGDVLTRVAETVRAGFEAILKRNGKTQWPAQFDERAKKAVRNIVKRLNQVDSITLKVDEAAPLLIDRVVLEEEFGRAHQFAEYGSIDGKLDLISVRGKPHFTIQDQATSRHVRCTFSDAVFEKVKESLGQRVVVDGLIKTDPDGLPISISGVLDVRPVPGPQYTIEQIIGKLPRFTGGISAGEYVRRLREEEDGDD